MFSLSEITSLFDLSRYFGTNISDTTGY